jgi:dynein heavy chain, axonemal
VDPILDDILEKNYTLPNTRRIRWGDGTADLPNDFRLYMTSKLANPELTPEIMSKTCVINFTVTFTGLKDQLLNEVVALEDPKTEETRKMLVENMS